IHLSCGVFDLFCGFRPLDEAGFALSTGVAPTRLAVSSESFTVSSTPPRLMMYSFTRPHHPQDRQPSSQALLTVIPGQQSETPSQSHQQFHANAWLEQTWTVSPSHHPTPQATNHQPPVTTAHRPRPLRPPGPGTESDQLHRLAPQQTVFLSKLFPS